MFKYLDFKKWIYSHSVDSTNKRLIEYSHFIPSTNILLYSYRQTAGKGQFGNKWYSGADQNLSFSIKLPLSRLLATDQFAICYFISVALKGWFDKQIGPKTSEIKWPNDLYIGNKKIAGILIQNTLKGKEIDHTVIGIGINVNTEEFPSDLPNPTSLAVETGKQFDLNDLMVTVIKEISNQLGFFQLKDLEGMRRLYEESLFLKDKLAVFKNVSNEKVFTGKILGVEHSGKIIMEREHFGRELFNYKELKYIL